MLAFLSKNQTIILKIFFIIFSVLFIIPSIIYMVNNETVLGFNTYYNFFINDNSNKIISSIIYLAIFIILAIIYLYFFKKKECFKNIKQVLIYTGIISGIFLIMLPWTTSDIFYYMGVGELNSVYGQNPYYVTLKDYGDENNEILKDDEIMEQGHNVYWAGTTVIYGPVAQLIFSCIAKLSFKNIDLCLLLFKLVNLIIHLLNCFIIYKLTKKLKFSILYGLNPFILLEFIANVHNDIIVVFFILLALYFLLKKKKILPSIVFLSLATGMKYFAILLLPVVVLYHYRNEEKIWKRFLKCIQYGLIFLGIVLLEYLVYLRDTSIFLAIMVQNQRLSKSIYSGLIGWGILKTINPINIFGEVYSINELSAFLKNIVFVVFTLTYIKFCIDLLTTKKIKIKNCLRKYNRELIVFLFVLGTFQQWYIIWLFATIAWQKSNTIKNIIIWTLASEVANSVYMFNKESFLYDMHFWGIMAIILGITCLTQIGLSIIEKQKLRS